jgi:hypothetical protein
MRGHTPKWGYPTWIPYFWGIDVLRAAKWNCICVGFAVDQNENKYIEHRPTVNNIPNHKGKNKPAKATSVKVL